jgi:hypothetical protein
MFLDHSHLPGYQFLRNYPKKGKLVKIAKFLHFTYIKGFNDVFSCNSSKHQSNQCMFYPEFQPFPLGHSPLITTQIG